VSKTHFFATQIESSDGRISLFCASDYSEPDIDIREVSAMQNLAQHRRLLITLAVLIAIAAAVTLLAVYSGGGGGGGGY
jgi:hypothetical protein